MPDSKAVALSGTLYQQLLAAYPKAHRREYGQPMVQLFRDQCRDAWRGGRTWGLIWLWLRVLPDLVKTSVLEHISTLNERKTMLERIGMLLRPRSAPWFVFIAVFATVFLLVGAASTLITLLLPEVYGASSVRSEWWEACWWPLAAGAGMALIAAWLGRKSCGTGAPPAPGAEPPPDLPHADGRPAKSALDKLTGFL
jgi:hypothetical protein